MTINTAASKITYATNGTTTVWPFLFSASKPSDIHLFFTDALGGITEVDPVLYQVALTAPVPPNPTSASGGVIFPLSGPPLAGGSFLTIVREAPVDQETSIANQSIVYPPIIEQALDNLAMLIQQMGELLGRSIQVHVSEPNPAQLPSVNDRKNRYAVFDASGNLVAGPPV